MTSSSSNEEEENSGANKGTRRQDSRSGSPKSGRLRGGEIEGPIGDESTYPPKKRKRRRKKPVQTKGESAPLLGDDR
jgi:hypothetical protein